MKERGGGRSEATHTMRERDMTEGRWGKKKRKESVSVGACDTLVTFNDMLPVLFPSLSHASVIHKGLYFPDRHWVATSLEVPPLSITNKQGGGLVGLH